jgi:methionyl-tRNA formyltransferase
MNGGAGRVLFFGKYDCAYSQQTHAYLEHLGFDVLGIWSRSRNEPLPDEARTWLGDYIFCFRSYFVLPAAVIAQAAIAAINFHPAPTEYPGSGCLNWALYDGATQYGVTAHIMNAAVDNGPIVECRRFPILPQDNVTTLLARAHQKTFDLIVDVTTGLALGGGEFLAAKLAAAAGERWCGKARRMSEIDRLQVVDVQCTKAELERVIRATSTPAFPPKIQLHGYTFVLAPEH